MKQRGVGQTGMVASLSPRIEPLGRAFPINLSSFLLIARAYRVIRHVEGRMKDPSLRACSSLVVDHHDAV